MLFVGLNISANFRKNIFRKLRKICNSSSRSKSSVTNCTCCVRVKIFNEIFQQPFMDIPYVDLFENNPETCINIRDFCVGRKIILIGLPGAFTPVCSKKHLPEFIRRADEFKKLGVDEIACISVNDPYTMCAWGKYHDAQGRVRMFSDPQACLAQALGVTIDLPCLGGIRSKRYSMVLTNARIQEFNIEPDGIGLKVSRAECIRV